MGHPLTILMHEKEERIDYTIIGDGLKDPIHGVSPDKIRDIQKSVQIMHDKVDHAALKTASGQDANAEVVSDLACSAHGAMVARAMFAPAELRAFANAVQSLKQVPARSRILSAFGDAFEWVPWEALYFPPTEREPGFYLSDCVVPCRSRFRETHDSGGSGNRNSEALHLARICAADLLDDLARPGYSTVDTFRGLEGITRRALVVLVCARASADADAIQLIADGPHYDIAATNAHPMGMHCINVLFSCGTVAGAERRNASVERNAIANALVDNCHNTVLSCSCAFPVVCLNRYVREMEEAVASCGTLVEAILQWRSKVGPLSRMFRLSGEWDWDLSVCHGGGRS